MRRFSTTTSILPVLCALAAGFLYTSAAYASQASSAPSAMDNPLSVQALVRLPALQPTQPILRGQPYTPRVGDIQAPGITRGAWSYSVRYEYTPDGWRFVGYRVAATDAEQWLGGWPGAAGEHVYPNLLPAGDSFEPGGAPGPADFPRPPYTPSTPAAPHWHSGTSCRWPSFENWGAKVRWKWVPEHEQTLEDGSVVTVPGQWMPYLYEVGVMPTSFCPHGG